MRIEDPSVDRRGEHGPFDIVGDVHGCFAELHRLLARLGWQLDGSEAAPSARHPDGRVAVFLGDLVDRGPATPAVVRLVMRMVTDGVGLCVPGNHDVKLVRKLRGKEIRVSHGLAQSIEQLDRESNAFREQVADFLEALPSHAVLDEGRLIVAHAGLTEELHGRASKRVRAFALYGDTTGETDEYGLPVRQNWAAKYSGAPLVVYGHMPTLTAEWLNNTICLDTGCVFGGKLTALRYPERELVQVDAAMMYYEPARPLAQRQS